MFQPLVHVAIWAAASALPAANPVPESVPAAIQDPATAAPADPKWTGSVAAGATLTSGNSETRQANASADAEYKRENDRTTLSFLWVYSENRNNAANDWDLTDRKTFGKGKYDYFFSPKTYGYGQATAEGDLLADIALRWTAGAGAGHQYIDTDVWKFSIEAGLAYIDTDYRTSTTTDTEDFAARIATTLAHQLSKSWDIGHNLEAYPSLEDADDFYGRSDLRIGAKLTESMVAGFQWVLDYDNTPAAGRERIDNRYLISVGWKF